MWKLQPPWNKSPALSQQPPSKSWGPVKLPLFENLVGGSITPLAERGGGCPLWFVETSLFVDGRSVGSYSYFTCHQIIEQQNVARYIAKFSDETNVLQQQFLYCFVWSSNQPLNLNISFLFLQTFLFINSISLFWRLKLLPAFTD